MMMASLDDPEELEYYWIEWRNVSGKLMKENYTDYVTLLNKAATEAANGVYLCRRVFISIFFIILQ